MESSNRILLSLPELAGELNLPSRWLKAEAEAGRIPHLNVNGWLLFNRSAVESVLAERAACNGMTAVSG